MKVLDPHLVVIALGSNLGNSHEIIVEAVHQLRALSTAPLLKSSLWESSPVNCPPGSPNFVNAVVGITPLEGETPESLLRTLQEMEKEFGRRPKKILNEPRPLDLDLIVFGQETRASDFLRLPHPRARERRFVLEPLAEIAPGLIFPGENRTVAQLLQKLRTDEVLRKISCSIS